MSQEAKVTDYEDAVLSILAYEFSPDDRRETEAKIKRKLRVEKLGKYDQKRIDLLRHFKNDVRAEISKGWGSKYYTHAHGEFANMEDFDRGRMTRELATAFPVIPEQSVSMFVEYAIYLYYIR